MTEWVKCSERMPEDNETVLLYGPRFLEPVVGWWGNWCDTKDRWVYFDGVSSAWTFRHYFTHWMPLPAPPAEDL